jgi:hypothetical protein
MHMKCNRGSFLPCLDWREICGEKIDCLELEMNHCHENEYQCRNEMCINEAFLLDARKLESNTHECLDRSDELLSRDSSRRCNFTPRFVCDDTACEFSDQFLVVMVNVTSGLYHQLDHRAILKNKYLTTKLNGITKTLHTFLVASRLSFVRQRIFF